MNGIDDQQMGGQVNNIRTDPVSVHSQMTRITKITGFTGITKKNIVGIPPYIQKKELTSKMNSGITKKYMDMQEKSKI